MKLRPGVKYCLQETCDHGNTLSLQNMSPDSIALIVLSLLCGLVTIVQIFAVSFLIKIFLKAWMSRNSDNFDDIFSQEISRGFPTSGDDNACPGTEYQCSANFWTCKLFSSEFSSADSLEERATERTSTTHLNDSLI